MMCKGTADILCPKVVLQKQSFPNLNRLDRVGLRYGTLRPPPKIFRVNILPRLINCINYFIKSYLNYI